MSKEKLVRQCISCRKQFSREGLIRLTKAFNINTGLKEIVINPNRYQLGRSVYICKSESCIRLAVKGKKVEKMLKVSANNLEEISCTLENYTEATA